MAALLTRQRQCPSSAHPVSLLSLIETHPPLLPSCPVLRASACRAIPCDDMVALTVLMLVGATVGAATFVTAPIVGLSVLGFGSVGPVAGSIAAAVQGPVTIAGGWFAVCQSAAMGGFAAGTLTTLAGVGGAVGAAISRALV
jgi:hypothetical protein